MQQQPTQPDVVQPPGSQATGSGNPFTARLCLLGAAFLWSFGGVFIKTLTGKHGMAPEALACLRSLVAGLVLAWALPRLRRVPFARVSGAGAAYAFIVGTFVAATTDTTAANAIFLQYAYPLIVAVGARIIYSERIGARTTVALAIGMAGVATIVMGSWNPQHMRGVGYGLVSATAFGVFTLIQRGIKNDAVALASLYNLIAAALILPFAIGKFACSTQALLLVVVMGAVQLAVPYVLFIKGLQQIPAAEAALVTLIAPVLNPLWVWMIVSETPTVQTVIGGAVILFAVATRFSKVAA